MTGQHVGISIHFEHEGEQWTLSSSTSHFEHMNKSETTFRLNNHGTGGDAPIKERYEVTTDELAHLIKKGATP